MNFDFENIHLSFINITLAIIVVLLFLIETPGVNFGDHPLLNKSAARGRDALSN